MNWVPYSSMYLLILPLFLGTCSPPGLMAPSLQELWVQWGRQVRGQKVTPRELGAEGPEENPE